MNSKYINRQLYILPAILSVWLIISSSLLVWFDRAYSYINILFMLLACLFCLSHSLRAIGWIVAVTGAAVYFGIHFSINGVTGDGIRVVSLGIVSILGAAVLCTFTAEQLNQVFMQIRYSRKMIEELRVIDPISGLIRFHYARKNINTEVARCQRYNKYLCLVIARVSNWNDLVNARGMDVSQQIMADVGEQFRKSIRNVDLAYINIEKIGVILPETRLEGAVQVAHRIVENCTRKAKVNLNVGIAAFPEDAIQDAELIRSAEAALQISISSGQTIVVYSQIKQAMGDESGGPSRPAPSRSFYPQDDPQSVIMREQMILQVLPPYQDEPAAAREDYKDINESWVKAEVLETEPEISSNGELDENSGVESETDNARLNPEPAPALDKSDWVKPYKPPVTNLRLESMSEIAPEGVAPATKQEEVLIGIHGVEQISGLPEIEKAVSAVPSVSRVNMVDFNDQTLVLKLGHSSDNIIETLKTFLTLPFEDIRGGSEWIEVFLKK